MMLCKCSYCCWWALLLVGIQLSVGLNVASSGAVSHECDGRNIQIRVQGSFIVNKRWILTLLDTDGGRHFFTDSYASRCGFTMSSDHRGTLILDATLLSCDVYDQNDSFNLDTEWVFENISWTLVPETVVYRATCREHYDWASREILCAQNYMEVSVDQTSPRIPDYARSEADWLDDITMFIPSDQIWRLVFTVAGQRQGVMTVEEAVRIGYSINSSISDTRVVFRSPYFTNHTYAVTLENGLVIQMIKPLVYFRRFGLTLLLDMVIACPLSRPQPLERWLSWSIPLQPPVLQEWSLLMVPDVQLVVGKHLLDDKAMAQRGVILSRNSSYMMLKVPWGVAGGINQSCVEHGQQGLLYSVDLQLLVTWQRLSTKLILFTKGSSPCQMTTQQFLHGPVGVHCKQDMFQLIVGPYKEDIYLTNVTIGNTAFIVCGFYADGEVSFATSPALCERAGPVGYKMYMVSAEPASYYLYLEVLYSVCPVIGSSTNDVHSYQLPVALLFMDPTMMKPISFFSTMVCDVHEPSYMGTCTEEGLKLVISSSLLGPHWLLFEGGTWLGPSNLRRLGYNLHRNGTHLSLVVPHGAEGLLYEETDPSHVRYSFTLLLKDNVTLETKTNFTVTCRAPAAQISCFPNGTVAFTAPRVDIKPPVDMSKLALHDSSCGPKKVGPNGAYFEFGVDTCGTLRKLHDDFLVYENELSVPRETLSFGHTFITRDNVYRLKVTCSYRLNDTLSLIASARSGQRAHFAFAPVLPIQMVFRQAEQHEMDLTFRMAKDEHFSEYYVPSEYPVVKFLQDPLFFEVRLLGLNYKNIELFLDNCWATERPNRDSIPQWPVITKSCPNALDSHRTIFHHVIGPESSNAKRFEVKTFIFGGPDRDESQLFFHCSIILCDTSNIDMLCKLDCIPQKQRAVRSTREGLLHGSVSSGGVLLLPSPDSPLATPANKMSKTKEVWKELVVVGLAGLALAALISTMIYLFKSATAAVVLT